MKVTKTILSIPPYVSTAWKHVSALRLEQGNTLIVELFNGTRVEIPGMDEAALTQIFEAHGAFLESEEREESSIGQLLSEARQLGEQVVGLPMRFGPGGFEGMGGTMQHDPSMADAPDLPPEVLDKITGISQVLGAENAESLPAAEENCNCIHCQIARAIQRGVGPGEEELILEEEVVSDEDLTFREWDIEDLGSDLYLVKNPLEATEEYKVCLKPVGCTCGQEGCEHVQAVLKS